MEQLTQEQRAALHGLERVWALIDMLGSTYAVGSESAEHLETAWYMLEDEAKARQEELKGAFAL